MTRKPIMQTFPILFSKIYRKIHIIFIEAPRSKLRGMRSLFSSKYLHLLHNISAFSFLLQIACQDPKKAMGKPMAFLLTISGAMGVSYLPTTLICFLP